MKLHSLKESLMRKPGMCTQYTFCTEEADVSPFFLNHVTLTIKQNVLKRSAYSVY